MKTVTGARRPRRTARVLVHAIHAAVLAELNDLGYSSVTFEGVARRAGTSKPVLYRRYRSRAQMVLSAIQHHTPPVTEHTFDGPLAADLFSLLRAARDRFNEFGMDTYRGILGEADDAVSQQVHAFTADFSIAVEAALIAARGRAEIGPRPVPYAVARVPLVLLRDCLVFGGATDGDISEIVDTVVLPLVHAVADSYGGANSQSAGIGTGRT